MKTVAKYVIMVCAGTGLMLFPAARLWAEGPLDLKLRAGDVLSYDDNVTYAHRDRKADIIDALFLGFDANYQDKLTTAEVTGNIRHQVFSRDKKFDNTSEDITASLSHEFSPYDRLSVKDAFVHAEEPRSFQETFGETNARNSYYHNVLGVEYAKDLNSRVTATLKAGNDVYERSQKGLPSSALNTVGGKVDWSLSSADVISPEYDLGVRTYHGASRSTEHSVGVNYRHYFTRQFYSDIRPGWDVITAADGSRATRPDIAVSLTEDIDKNTRMVLGYLRNDSVNFYSREIFNAWQTNFSLVRGLTSRLSADVTAFYGEGVYQTSKTSNRLTGVSLGFTYDVARNAKAFLTYANARVDSNDPAQTYTRNVVSLGIEYLF